MTRASIQLMNRDQISKIRSLLQNKASGTQNSKIFFKTGSGQYAEHDQFIGVSVPKLRIIAKEFYDLPLADITTLITSPFNEERLLALFILVDQYAKASEEKKEEIYQFYLNHLSYVNNWNLVDASAHLIVGAHLWKKDKNLLIRLAQSPNLWERRIAIVATWYFIRHNNLEWTFKIATMLLDDTHDLIHKAVGWMLREAGKRNETELLGFLDAHATKIPRTMLRYAIEKLPENVRKSYLLKK